MHSTENPISFLAKASRILARSALSPSIWAAGSFRLLKASVHCLEVAQGAKGHEFAVAKFPGYDIRQFFHCRLKRVPEIVIAVISLLDAYPR